MKSIFFKLCLILCDIALGSLWVHGSKLLETVKCGDKYEILT